MLQFFSMVRDFWVSIISLFDRYPITIGNYQVSYFSLVFAFLVIFLVVSVFWKGARA